MTDDRSLERAARSWLEVGPTEAPPHAVDAALLRIQTTSQERDWNVPRRAISMSPFARLTAAATLGVLLVGGVLLITRPGSGVGGPSAPPSASVSPSAVAAVPSGPASPAIPALDSTFTSTTNAFTVGYPRDRPVTRATLVWRVDDYGNYDSALSDLIGTDRRFLGSSTRLAPGESFEHWFAAYDATRLVPTCVAPAREEPVTIDGLDGVLDLHCPALYAEAVVNKGNRVWVFTTWHPEEMALFSTMLESIKLTPPAFVEACSLVTTQQVLTSMGNPGLGAIANGSGSTPETSCRYTNGPGDTILGLTYTEQGGKAAFDAVKTAVGVQAVTDVGPDAMFDPATKTLYVSRGDAMVAIVAGASSQSPADRLRIESAVARLLAGQL